VKDTLALKILLGSLRSYIDNFHFFFRTSLPWLFICLPVYWLGKDYVIDHPHFDDLGNLDSISILIDVFLAVLLSVAFSSIAVSWHRHILNGSRVPLITFDYTVWRYLWNGILIMLMTALVATPVILAIYMVDLLNSALQVLVALLVPIALYIIIFLMMYRLSIKLPALAIGRPSYGFKESWNDTKGQIWQFLILGAIMTFIGKLVSSIEQGMQEQLPQMDSFLGRYGLISVEPVVELIFTGLAISILTYTYAYFAEGREL
jgi:hypothetical protein